MGERVGSRIIGLEGEQVPPSSVFLGEMTLGPPLPPVPGEVGSVWLAFEDCELGSIEVLFRWEWLNAGWGRVGVWPGHWNPWWISNSWDEQ